MKDNVALKEARAKLAEIERQRQEAVIALAIRMLIQKNRRMQHDQT